jgi:hypothetical protein
LKPLSFLLATYCKCPPWALKKRATQLDPRHLEDFTACLEVGCARFAKKNFSHRIEIKQNWIRFSCVPLFTIKFHFYFFAYFCFKFFVSLRFSNFRLEIFASHKKKPLNFASIQYFSHYFASQFRFK